jgi:hypothetical protein
MMVAPRDSPAIEMVVSACSQPLLGRAADTISSRACGFRSGLSMASRRSKRVQRMQNIQIQDRQAAQHEFGCAAP